ncbi:hypothetical protein [Nocardioides sp.]|uniref:hypothetical protein n=1 Tax=Nocardioides sp. TaxID=35761 RepID=UPI002C1F03FD|nr:hypothetical protein [Nocardioides sp.]HXH77484.1 hypothetical protein [Nocardioides sp.]
MLNAVPYSLRQLVFLVGGCVVLGVGAGMLLTAELGSDGYSTLVNGISLWTGTSFWIANVLVGTVFVAMAAARHVRPGPGTVVQVVLVGVTVSGVLALLDRPDGLTMRLLLLAAAFPVVAVGIVVYLGSDTGAGPAEAAALAWDPPVPFRWSYSAVQGGGALVGWLLGAKVGLGTLAVILLLGLAVDLTSRLLGLDVHQAEDPAGPKDTAA